MIWAMWGVSTSRWRYVKAEQPCWKGEIQFGRLDREFKESLVEHVGESGEYYEVKHDGGWTIGVQKVAGLPAPQVGERIRTYGRGIGYSVRGIVIGGRVYRYQTEAEEQAEQERLRLVREAEAEATLERTRAETDRRIAALPPVFRARLEKFQRDGGHEFRRDYESYELFCCEQAVVFAEALKTPEALKAWRGLTFPQQKQQVPGLEDGHSGNTFGMAYRLAHWYLTNPDVVTQEHGALVPLVGCTAYGCKHEGEA